jgi:hypothetical protein
MYVELKTPCKAYLFKYHGALFLWSHTSIWREQHREIYWWAVTILSLSTSAYGVVVFFVDCPYLRIRENAS